MKCKNCSFKLKLFWNCCPNCGEKIKYSFIRYLIYLLLILFVLGVSILKYNNIYGTMVLLALLLNIFIVLNISKQEKFKTVETIFLILYELIGIIIGGKLLTYFFNLGKSSFFDAGLTAYGSLLGLIIMLIIYKFQFKKSFNELVKLCISFPLMYAVGKIGCFAAGCCYGIEYSGPFSITYKNSLEAPNGISLFPIQIIESFVFLIIFICAWYHYKSFTNYQAIQLLFICAISKFSLDFLRTGHINDILSLNQIISLLFIIFGIVILIINRRRRYYEVSKV